MTTAASAHRRSPGPGGSWLARLPIGSKLVLAASALVAVVGATVASVSLGFQVADGSRGYVTGESLWSKGQKDAAYSLRRYAETGNATDYQRYRRAIRVPQLVRLAREAMQQADPDDALATELFRIAGVSRADAADMVSLYRRFGGLGPMREATAIWTQGDVLIRELETVAAALHAAVTGGAAFDAPLRRALSQRIDRINARLTPIELDFTRLLADLARSVNRGLLGAIVLMTAILLLLALWAANRVTRQMTRAIRDLEAGARRVSDGDLAHPVAVRGADELGQLARAFNEMIGARRRAESRLVKDAEFQRVLLDNLTECIVACDADGHLSLFNRATLEAHGLPSEPLPPERWASHYDLLDAETLAPMPTDRVPLYRAYTGETVRDAEIVIAPLGLPSRIMRCNGQAMYTPSGEKIGAVVAMVDVTRAREDEQALRRHADELQRSNDELERFAYVASHDLQEPLRTLTSYSQLLLRRLGPDADADAHEFAEHIRVAAHRMQDMLQGLLEYSRASGEPLPNARVDLNSVCREAADNLGSACERTEGEIEFPGTLPAVIGDRAQLVRVFQNLFGNALKFRGQQPPRVRITAVDDGQRCTLSVEDNGIGIPEDQHEKVFRIYQRLHPIDVYDGAGLGLSICRRIIDRHGGTIWIAPTDQGTRICVELSSAPAAPAEAAPLPAD